MRWIATLAATLVVALGLVGAVPQPACACSCVGFSLQEHFENADVVFAGTLVSRDEDDGLLRSTADKATLTFEVSAVYKGKVAARQEIVTHASGASCGLELTGPGPHLVFGNAGGPDYELEAGEGQYIGTLCSGSRPLDAAAQAELKPLAKAGKPAAGTAGKPAAGTASPAGGTSTGWIGAGAAALVLIAAGTGLVWWRRRSRGSGHLDKGEGGTT